MKFFPAVHFFPGSIRRQCILLTVLLLTTLPLRAAASESQFSDARWFSLGDKSSPSYRVYAAVVNEAGELFVSGSFSEVGDQVVNFVAKWNGSSWSSLGSGMNNSVFALAVSGNDLYAGGSFTTAGGIPANHVARWNGSSWQALGSGVNSTVSALAVSDGMLYVGGRFSTAGNVNASCIARWNGSSWSSLGSGMALGSPFTSVNALTVCGSRVVAGGSFSQAGSVIARNIAEWNGTQWQALGDGVNKTVWALAASGDILYAGGAFTTAGNVDANHIAEWDGSDWETLGSGVNNWVLALTFMDDRLYAGGTFTSAGGQSASYIAQWESGTWSPMGSGLSATVYALATSGNDLYAGGAFSVAGGKPASYLARAELAEAPPIDISRSGQNLIVSWPSEGTEGFQLEECDSLDNPTGWMLNESEVHDDAIIKSVTIPLSEPHRFLRLRIQ